MIPGVEGYSFIGGAYVPNSEVAGTSWQRGAAIYQGTQIVGMEPVTADYQASQITTRVYDVPMTQDEALQTTYFKENGASFGEMREDVRKYNIDFYNQLTKDYESSGAVKEAPFVSAFDVLGFTRPGDEGAEKAAGGFLGGMSTGALIALGLGAILLLKR